MNEEEYKQASIELEATGFSAGLALEQPDMYSTDEMVELTERTLEATAAADKLMRDDLASMPPEMQEKMKDMLRASLPEDLLQEIFGEDF